MNRRGLLSLGAKIANAALLGAVPTLGSASDEAYKVLVVVYLNGGNDGNNVLVPTDGMYSDYQRARQNLALPLSSLATLSGSSAGHRFGVHGAMAPLTALYEAQRLAFISNVGPLVVPCTAEQVLNNTVELPPFLGSHSDQTAMVQGWTVSDDMSGWAGRSLERLPPELRHRVAAMTMDTNRTLVLGKQSPVTFLTAGADGWWGIGDLSRPQEVGAQALRRIAQFQSRNPYESEYARTFGGVIDDASYLIKAYNNAITPQGEFGNLNDGLPRSLHAIASILPYFKSHGLRRQVILLHWGGFDTHTNQRGSDMNSQDTQLSTLATALRGFDDSNRLSGLDNNVVTLVMSEFGRTVRPGSGGGSEHAWGNHWWALGGPIAGGQVIGAFPSPVLGGKDDGDPGQNGRFVPTISSDQVGASLMAWMGLSPSHFQDVFPHLVNFESKTIPLLRG